MRVDDDRSALWTKHHISRKVKSLKKATGVRTVGSGLREVKEIYEERVGGGGGELSGTREGLLLNRNALLSSPLWLSAYPLSDQSVSQASSAPVSTLPS